jgi:putative (di)nucleoside polyphosphate hydrolase
VIDTDGYRPNVGIILSNRRGQVLWARRVGQAAWQFPQGGIRRDEHPQEALFRELFEELGLHESDVELIGSTQGWLHYRLPKRYVRRSAKAPCIGQKQIWFLLELLSTERALKLDGTGKPEFDSWKWVNYWHPSREVIAFKREVYRRALKELAPLFYSRLDSSPSGCRSVV